MTPPVVTLMPLALVPPLAVPPFGLAAVVTDTLSLPPSAILLVSSSSVVALLGDEPASSPHEMIAMQASATNFASTSAMRMHSKD